MRHRNLLAALAIGSLICLVAWHPQTAAAQQAADGSHPVQIWDAKTSKDVLTLKGHTNGLVSVAFFPDGERILTGSGDRTAQVWDAKTGKNLLTIEGTGGNGCYAAVSADGSRILTTNIPIVKIWDAKTGRELVNLTDHVGLHGHWPFPYRGSFSPDGKKVAVSSPVFNLTLFDATTGDELVTLKKHGYWPNDAVFSPDGSRLLSGCQTADDAARLWDTESGTELFALKDHGESVWAMGFAPDGKRFATAGANRKVHVWDTKRGVELLTLVGHEKVVTAVSFSSDGKWILSGSQDGTARLWDAQQGTERFVLKGHSDIVTDASFSPVGKRIVTASWRDKTALVWDFQRFLDADRSDPEATPAPPK